MKKQTKRIISLILTATILFGTYYAFISKAETTGEVDSSSTKIDRIYDNGENAAIMTLEEINTVSTTNINIKIPAYTQFRAYAFENTLREENTYSFKFRGLDVEYEVEYKDDTSKPTVLLFKEENIYILKENKDIYLQPNEKAKKTGEISADTTILIEYSIGNGWVYCVTGNMKKGWVKLTPKKEETKFLAFENTEFLLTKYNVKPSFLFDDIALFLNQFPNIKGITITTLSQ